MASDRSRVRRVRQTMGTHCADYRVVFRIVSTVAFCGYSLAILQSTIWWYRSWGYTLRTMFDGLIYALLTGGTFGWLWP